MGNSTLRGWYFIMKNNFINNNGAILPNTKKNPKTKVESQIEVLKQQEQAIISELERWETKQKKVDKLLGNLREVELFSRSSWKRKKPRATRWLSVRIIA